MISTRLGVYYIFDPSNVVRLRCFRPRIIIHALSRHPVFSSTTISLSIEDKSFFDIRGYKGSWILVIIFWFIYNTLESVDLIRNVNKHNRELQTTDYCIHISSSRIFTSMRRNADLLTLDFIFFFGLWILSRQFLHKVRISENERFWRNV